METEQIIKEFLTKMAEQDNRSTRAPYYYVIQSKEEYQADLMNCEETRFRDDDGDCSYNSIAEFRQQLLDDEEWTESEIEKKVNNLTEYGISTRWTEHGLFFTEEEAKDHLRCNHYHYSSDARTYVKHAWRAPELEKFMKALFTHFKIEDGNYKL